MTPPSDNPYAPPAHLADDENEEWPLKVGPPYWPALVIVGVGVGLFVVTLVLAREFGLFFCWMPAVALGVVIEGIRRWRWAGVHCLAGPRGILVVRAGIFIPWSFVGSLRIKELPPPGWSESSADTCLIITMKPEVFDNGTHMLQYYSAQRVLVRYYGLAGASAARKQELGLPLFGLEPGFVSDKLVDRLSAMGHVGPTIGPPPGSA